MKSVVIAIVVLLRACSSGSSDPTTTVPLSIEDGNVDWLEVIERTREESRLSIRTEIAAGQFGDGTVYRAVYDLDLVAARSTVEYGGQHQEEILVDGETGWVRLADPGFVNRLPEGVQYVEAATVELVAAGLINLEPDRAMPLLYALAGASSTEVIEEIEGRLSYSVDIDPALLAVQIPERLVPSFRATIGDLLDPNRAAAIEASVSLDDEGRIVSLLIEMTPHQPVPHLLIQLEIGSFGEPVVIDGPDSDTVVHIDDVLGLRRTVETASSALRRSERR